MSSNDIQELSPPQAYHRLLADKSAVLLDVRSRFEYEYVGHPETAINVAWQELPEWKVDPGFVDKVRQALEALPDRAVPPEQILILAARKLAENGFVSVINIAEGFEGDLDAKGQRGNLNGWRYHRLPWRQG
jgi:rhodanese-related sulfurtransferase